MRSSLFATDHQRVQRSGSASYSDSAQALVIRSRLLESRPNRFRSHGFTLLELVVAFVIMALALGALMEVNASSLRAARRSAAMTEAALLAKSKLDEFGVGVELDEGRENGRFEGTAYRWELDVRKEEPPPTATGLIEEVPIDLYRLELTVRWREGPHERSAKFATVRAIQPQGGV